jgi:hypothetical protein
VSANVTAGEHLHVGRQQHLLKRTFGFIIAIAKVSWLHMANETSLLDAKLLESLGRSQRSDVNDYWTFTRASIDRAALPLRAQ